MMRVAVDCCNVKYEVVGQKYGTKMPLPNAQINKLKNISRRLQFDEAPNDREVAQKIICYGSQTLENDDDGQLYPDENLSPNKQYHTGTRISRSPIASCASPRDFSKKNSNCIVSCYDLQAVMTVPKGEISVFYYKIKYLPIKSITHTFLIKGHTQNEGEAVPSMIEKEVKKMLRSGPIYVPDKYIAAIKNAHKKGNL
ncbi:unnamed protein product [Leptosia nina]|uniref:Uncharacterized protein n=1 Tax=Leptosia nina TaxID=320188 RepID=A0AAV1JLE4_9NEOP